MEIVNRVAESALEVFDLEEYYPAGPRVRLDIGQWLQDGLLREKPFRETLRNWDWQQYSGAYVAVDNQADAIVPAWAEILVATYLAPVAKKVVIGDENALESVLYRGIIEQIDFEKYRDKPVILKGCARKPVPRDAYVAAVSRLQSVAKSVMYGEACSAVPLYKRK